MVHFCNDKVREDGFDVLLYSSNSVFNEVKKCPFLKVNGLIGQLFKKHISLRRFKFLN